MKIAHVQVVPQLSGVQQISLDILTGLQSNENQLYIICGQLQDFSNDFIQAFQRIGVVIIEVPSLQRDIGKHDLIAFNDLYHIFKKYNFDIVHTNSTKPAILARIAAKIAGCKRVIHTIHGVAFHAHIPCFKRIFFYFIEYFSVLFGDEQISVNKYYKKFYPLINTRTIYNGVDFASFDLENKKNKKNITFAFFARLDDQKNPLEFIEAIYLLKLENLINESTHFILAGDGELKEECIKMIKKLELEKIIEIYGWVKDKSAFLNRVDVICQPSKWEAFGLVFVEAAYFSIPAIASKVEGIPEVVLDGETGLLYTGGAEQLKN